MATNDTSLGQLKYDFILYETPIIKKDEYTKYDNYIIRYENIDDVLYIGLRLPILLKIMQWQNQYKIQGQY